MVDREFWSLATWRLLTRLLTRCERLANGLQTRLGPAKKKKKCLVLSTLEEPLPDSLWLIRSLTIADRRQGEKKLGGRASNAPALLYCSA